MCHEIKLELIGFYKKISFYEHFDLSTGCLKIDATHKHNNYFLLRQVQWRSFGTCPVKNASFQLPGHAIFFLISSLINKSLSDLLIASILKQF